jgi:hypothetical protein
VCFFQATLSHRHPLPPMSLPRSYKQGAPKDSAKRKQADDAPVPAVTSRRPPMPLPHTGLSRELPTAKRMAMSQGSAPSDRRVADPLAMSAGVPPVPLPQVSTIEGSEVRRASTEDMPQRPIITDKQKLQMFEHMEQENKELRRRDAERLQGQQRQDQELREAHNTSATFVHKSLGNRKNHKSYRQLGALPSPRTKPRIFGF